MSARIFVAESAEDQHELSFPLSFLTFAPFFATLLVYAPNLTIFKVFQGAYVCTIGLFSESMLAAFSLCGILMAVFGRMGTSASKAHTVLALGIVAYLLSATGLTFMTCLPVMRIPLVFMVDGILAGVGTVSALVIWGRTLSVLTLRQSLLFTAITFGIGAFISWILSVLDTPLFTIGFWMTFLSGIIIPCVKIFRKLPSHEASIDACIGLAESGQMERLDSANKAIRRAFWHDVIGVFFSPFIGLMVFALMLGMRELGSSSQYPVETIGTILAALFFIPILAIRTRQPTFVLIYRTILPFFACILLIAISFPDTTIVYMFGAYGIYVFFPLAALLAISCINATCHAGEFPSELLIGISCTGFGVASLAGIFIMRVLGSNSSALDSVAQIISTCYFVLLFIDLLRRSWQTDEDEIMQEQTTAPDSDMRSELDGRCAMATERYSLSARESEMLPLAVRGHNPIYISKTLIISESTTRSHIRDIYRKLGVNSRDELMDFFDNLQ